MPSHHRLSNTSKTRARWTRGRKKTTNDHSGGLTGGTTWERPRANRKMQTEKEKALPPAGGTGGAVPESRSLATGTWAQRPGYCLVPLTAPGRTVNKQLVLNKCSLISFMSKQCSIEKALNWEAEAEELSNFNLSRLGFES